MILYVFEMINKRRFTGFACIVVIVISLFCSCEKKLYIDMNLDDYKIVLNGVIEHNSDIKVHISHSLATTDKYYWKNINDAQVVMYEDGVFFDSLHFSTVMNGVWYRSSKKASEGKEYTVQVQHRILESVTAKTFIMDGTEVSLLQTEYYQEFENTSRIKYTFSFTDDPLVRNYYKVNFVGYLDTANGNYIESQYDIKFKLENAPFISDKSQENDNNEFVVDYWSPDKIFSDELINGKTVNFDVVILGLSDSLLNNTAEFSLQSVSEDLYRYHESYGEQDVNDDPFSEPVPMYSNVKNGLGILGGISSKSVSIVIPYEKMPAVDNWRYIYDWETVFSDEKMDW